MKIRRTWRSGDLSKTLGTPWRTPLWLLGTPETEMRGDKEIRRALSDLGDTFRGLEEMEDTFRDLHGDLREDFVDFKDMVDLLGDPSTGVGDPLDEDKDMEVKGPL